MGFYGEEGSGEVRVPQITFHAVTGLVRFEAVRALSFSKANGAQLRPKWENELEYAKLKLLELDRKIDGINGLA